MTNKFNIIGKVNECEYLDSDGHVYCGAKLYHGDVVLELIGCGFTNVDSEPLTEDDINKINECEYTCECVYCERCGSAHDTDAYEPDYQIVDECTVVCNDCLTADDLMIELHEVGDIFKSRDIRMIDDLSEFEEVATLFCDSSGLGSSNGPALTKSQTELEVEDILNKFNDEQLYCGLTGIGMFQVYVTIYKKGEHDEN